MHHPSIAASMHHESRTASPDWRRVCIKLIFGLLLTVAEPSILFAAPASPMTGGAFQCVTELINAAMSDKQRLKQLFYVAYSPGVSWMRISLLENLEPDEKSVRYTIRNVRNGVISAVNGNGLSAVFNINSQTLRLGDGNSHTQGTCDRLQ
ncbi:hypothetical protein [Burkholderia gladioli]|uniref:hypothetical protein n=1 Tax=Burkholderia gladioli TaxID=28095 RepID=UPI0012F9A485|nr:hypothetical protein [Burkholderia gladioli]